MKSPLQLTIEDKLKRGEEIPASMLYSLKMQLKHEKQTPETKDVTTTMLKLLHRINTDIEEKLTRLMPWWIEWYEQKIIDKHFNSL